MNLVLPERIEKTLSPQEAHLDLAIGLYSGGRVTMGTAAEIAGLPTPAFQRELGRRRIPVSYDLEELHHDFEALSRASGA